MLTFAAEGVTIGLPAAEEAQKREYHRALRSRLRPERLHILPNDNRKWIRFIGDGRVGEGRHLAAGSPAKGFSPSLNGFFQSRNGICFRPDDVGLMSLSAMKDQDLSQNEVVVS